MWMTWAYFTFFRTFFFSWLHKNILYPKKFQICDTKTNYERIILAQTDGHKTFFYDFLNAIKNYVFIISGLLFSCKKNNNFITNSILSAFRRKRSFIIRLYLVFTFKHGRQFVIRLRIAPRALSRLSLKTTIVQLDWAKINIRYIMPIYKTLFLIKQ